MSMTNTTLFLTTRQFQHLCQQAASQPGYEVCGLIGGRWQKSVAYAHESVSIPNISPRPDAHFIMSQSQLETTLRRFYRNKLSLVSIYHSHPFGPPHPSEQDIADSNYADAIYLILFPPDILNTNKRQAQPTPVFMGYTASVWRIINQQVDPARLLVIE